MTVWGPRQEARAVGLVLSPWHLVVLQTTKKTIPVWLVGLGTAVRGLFLLEWQRLGSALVLLPL